MEFFLTLMLSLCLYTLGSRSATIFRPAIKYQYGLCLDRGIGLWFSVSLFFVILNNTIMSVSGILDPMTVLIILTSGIASLPLLRSLHAKGRYRSPIVIVIVALITTISILLMSATSVVALVFFFESVVFLTVMLLIITGKSERVGESIQDMLTWAFGGSLLLILSVTLIQLTSSNILINCGSLQDIIGMCLFLGFAVKIPVWPCTSWLLKVHVEASTEFSIYLSGFLVKIGVIAMWKALVEFQLGFGILWLVRAFALIGLVEAVFRLYAQVDLKRFVAMTTIIETNWLTVCLYSGDTVIASVGFILVLIHAVTTSLEFYIVELIYRRYASRLLFVVSGVSASYPNLGVVSWLVVLTTLGLPGSSIFALKILFLVSVCKVSLALCVVYVGIFFLIMPIAIIRTWLPVLGGLSRSSSKSLPDIALNSLIFILLLILISSVIGFYPQIIL